MDDQALTRRALRGDDQAFRELFDIYFPRLFRFALRRVADEDAAEDIAQSTLVKAIVSTLVAPRNGRLPVSIS